MEMDQDLALPVDPMEVKDKWVEILKGLMHTKESISQASKFALENSYVSTELFQVILKRMAKLPHKRRLPLFHLIDSICQNAKVKGRFGDYGAIIIRHVGNIVSLIVPSIGEADREKYFSAVKKVLIIWESREILTAEKINEVYEQLEKREKEKEKEKEKKKEKEKEKGNHKKDTDNGKHPIKDVLGKHPRPEEISLEEKLLLIEEFRREDKKRRWEHVLRPINEDEFTEFHEMWEAVTEESCRTCFPNLENFKLDYSFGVPPTDLNNIFNEVVSFFKTGAAPLPFVLSPTVTLTSPLLSSPSPSPCTPYSPSLKSTGPTPSSLNKQTPDSEPSKIAYSPSSPSSSPEIIPKRTDDGPSLVNIPKEINNQKYVFIWDLDETLIVFNALLNNEFAGVLPRLSRDRAYKIGKKVEDFIWDILIRVMFFRDLETSDQRRIDDFQSFDDGKDLSRYDFKYDGFRLSRYSSEDKTKAAYRFRRVKEIYQGIVDYRHLLSPNRISEMNSLYSSIDEASEGWLSLSRSLLRITGESNRVVNIVVTSGHLLPALSKMIVYQLNDLIPPQNVYSSRADGKYNCFRDICSQYRGSKYFVIGDGKEEEEVSRQQNLHFFRISGIKDLTTLHTKLKAGIDTVFS